MAKKVYHVEGLEADPDHVREGTTYMYKEFMEYMKDQQYTTIDAFMIAHSFHKMVVLSVMARWSADGFDPAKTLHLADMTWRNSIEQVMRNLKKQVASETSINKLPEPVLTDFQKVIKGQG